MAAEGGEAAFPLRETDRRPASIAAMGYRLAAAGPRTRQRLLERERLPSAPGLTPVAPPEAEAASDPLPALSAWDDAAWERRISGEPEPALAALSVAPTGFPVWRAAALLASAACGFGLVLWGQSLHLDRKLRPTASRDAAAARLAAAAPPPPAAAPAAPAPLPATPAPADAQPAPLQTAAAAPLPAPPTDDRPPSASAAPPFPQAAAPPAPGSAARPVAPQFAAADPAAPPAAEAGPPRPPVARPAIRRVSHTALPAAERPHWQSSWAAAAPLHPAPRHPALRAATAVAHPAGPKPRATIRTAAVHYDLPRWLTEDHQQPERPLVMSPPPHDLESPPGAAQAARPAPASLPPIPAPAHRPTTLYAEARGASPPPAGGWNSRPYPLYPPSSSGGAQTYGYTTALPPPVPYGEP